MIASLATLALLAALAAGSAAAYLMPLLVGVLRRVPDLGPLAVVNVLLGWTLVGWVAALAMALRSPRPDGPQIQVVQNFPVPGPGPLAGPPGPAWLRPADAPPLALPPRTDPPDGAEPP